MPRTEQVRGQRVVDSNETTTVLGRALKDLCIIVEISLGVWRRNRVTMFRYYLDDPSTEENAKWRRPINFYVWHKHRNYNRIRGPGNMSRHDAGATWCSRRAVADEQGVQTVMDPS